MITLNLESYLATVSLVVIIFTTTFLLIHNGIKERRKRLDVFKKLNVAFVKPHWLFGSFRHLNREGQLPQEVMGMWLKEYGSVFGYFVGAKPTLVVANLDMVKEILIKQFHNFANRPRMVIEAQPVVSTIVGLRNQRWKEVRSVLAPTFSMSKMKLMMPIITKKLDLMTEIIEENTLNNLDTEWYSAYQGLTLDVISECALAMQTDCQRLQSRDPLLNSVRGFLRNAMNIAVEMAIYFPFLGKLFGFLSNKVVFSGRMTRNILSNLEQVIDYRRKHSKHKTIDVLQLLLDAAENQEENGHSSEVTGTLDKTLSDTNGSASRTARKKLLTDQEIIANAWVFLLGGFETTATALTSTTYLLARHPDVQQRLFEEIEAQGDSFLTWESITKMSYLDQVWQESLRLFPPVVTFMSRETREDCVVNGFKIPKNMTVMIPIWQIHRDPEQWSDPEEFIPERFASDEGRHPMAHIPFGAGPRNCIGMRFAQLEAKLALVRIIKKFRLDVSPLTPNPLTYEVPTVALNPKEKVWIRATIREHTDPSWSSSQQNCTFIT